MGNPPAEIMQSCIFILWLNFEEQSVSYSHLMEYSWGSSGLKWSLGANYYCLFSSGFNDIKKENMFLPIYELFAKFEFLFQIELQITWFPWLNLLV